MNQKQFSFEVPENLCQRLAARHGFDFILNSEIKNNELIFYSSLQEKDEFGDWHSREATHPEKRLWYYFWEKNNNPQKMSDLHLTKEESEMIFCVIQYEIKYNNNSNYGFNPRDLEEFFTYNFDIKSAIFWSDESIPVGYCFSGSKQKWMNSKSEFELCLLTL